MSEVPWELPHVAQAPADFPLFDIPEEVGEPQSVSSDLNLPIIIADDNSTVGNTNKARRPPKAVKKLPSSNLPTGYRPRLRIDRPWVKINSTTEGKNRRSAKIDSFDPSKVYDELDVAPEPWSHFEYSEHGELLPGATYSATELRDYLYNHPLHTYEGKTDRKRSRLRLWIQRAPADSARRKPSAFSDRCRYDNCPCPNQSIRIGHFRVCFDEQSWKKHAKEEYMDPFINAGYVHLYCMEKLIDFPRVVRDLNVRPETRKLKNELDGANRMDLGRVEVVVAADRFIQACNAGEELPDYPRLTADNPAGRPRPYKGTLNHRLQLAKLEAEQPCRQRKRMELGDKRSQIHHHLGDLEAQQREKEKTKAATLRKKRGRLTYETDDDESEQELEEEDAEVDDLPPAKRQRTTKPLPRRRERPATRKMSEVTDMSESKHRRYLKRAAKQKTRQTLRMGSIASSAGDDSDFVPGR
jgi:hypothetical protein